MATVATVHTVEDLRRHVSAWRSQGERVALVPTMGALHAGHLSLVRLAREHAARVVVSIFVNPAQFAPHEDFSLYPRTFESDLSRLATLATDLVFNPPVETMYPEGFATTVSLAGPAAVGLEDAFRPTHFAGVATVVAKLLIQAQADAAVFGEKDFQQLKVVSRMACDLDLPTEIVGAPTLRESDGLAMSSRNRYLSADARAKAPVLYRVLSECAERIKGGEPIAPVMGGGRETLATRGFDVDYLEARHAETLAPVVTAHAGAIRIVAAARLDQTRLIDNVAV